MEKVKKKSRVIRISSKSEWENQISRATNQAFPVVVHFSAFWCMPSVAMNPSFQHLSSSYQQLLFFLLDVDEVQEVATKMDIKAMPTFVMLSGGSEKDRIVGANPQELKKRIDAFLQSSSSQNSL
ncbi:thioredoxin-like protein CXXS1 [Prosopis cineraria]|uniref:thioredoxin-like protein CXXS1 n=1 Tax=Prosopis cineraria TaxID=364024 RepID=UPI002410AC8F|nr:thioredoxin-like protein CXXS1 [Prosopis cineraria]